MHTDNSNAPNTCAFTNHLSNHRPPYVVIVTAAAPSVGQGRTLHSATVALRDLYTCRVYLSAAF